MPLYLLIRNTRIPAYDCNNGVIVRAQNKEMARVIASSMTGDEGSNTWLSENHSSCVQLSEEGANEIILIDYNAG